MLDRNTPAEILSLLEDADGDIEFYVHGVQYVRTNGVLTVSKTDLPIDLRLSKKKSASEFKSYVLNELTPVTENKSFEIGGWKVLQTPDQVCCILENRHGSIIEFFIEPLN